jgi:sn-glycerol 3-phosphate transport system permease protein
MEKRVRFQSRWLPWFLVAPQMAIVLVFFFWPAGQALYQSVLSQDAFGTSTEFVGLENFERLFADSTYLESFKTTAVFSLLVAFFGLSISLLLAVMADRVLKGAAIYKTLLIWPYAVAPVVAGVLWLFMFASPMGVIAFYLRSVPVLFGWASVHPQIPAGGSGHRRGQPLAPLLDHRVPALVAHHVFPLGHQRGLRLF